MGAFLLTRAFFRSAHLLLLFLRRVRDAGVVHCPVPARGPALVAVAHCPEIPVHRRGSASSVRVVAVQKDYPFAAAHQTAGLDLLLLPLEKLLSWIVERV